MSEVKYQQMVAYRTLVNLPEPVSDVRVMSPECKFGRMALYLDARMRSVEINHRPDLLTISWKILESVDKKMILNPSAICQKSMILSINDKYLESLKYRPEQFFILKDKELLVDNYHPWIINFFKDKLPIVVKIKNLCILQEGILGYLLSIQENDIDILWEVDQQILEQDFIKVENEKDLRFLNNDILGDI